MLVLLTEKLSKVPTDGLQIGLAIIVVRVVYCAIWRICVVIPRRLQLLVRVVESILVKVHG